MSLEVKPVLNVAKLVKRFGGFYALDGLSFHVAPGEILGLVGPNGSGKTTAINVISGLYAPDGGDITFDGSSIGGIASHRLVHRGVNRTFQVPKPFLSLTVRENIKVALAYGRAAVAAYVDGLDGRYDLVVVAVPHQAYADLDDERVGGLVADGGLLADLKNLYAGRDCGGVEKWTL